MLDTLRDVARTDPIEEIVIHAGGRFMKAWHEPYASRLDPVLTGLDSRESEICLRDDTRQDAKKPAEPQFDSPRTMTVPENARMDIEESMEFIERRARNEEDALKRSDWGTKDVKVFRRNSVLPSSKRIVVSGWRVRFARKIRIDIDPVTDTGSPRSRTSNSICRGNIDSPSIAWFAWRPSTLRRFAMSI